MTGRALGGAGRRLRLGHRWLSPTTGEVNTTEGIPLWVAGHRAGQRSTGDRLSARTASDGWDVGLWIFLIIGGLCILDDVVMATVLSVLLPGCAALAGMAQLASAVPRLRPGRFWSADLGRVLTLPRDLTGRVPFEGANRHAVGPRAAGRGRRRMIQRADDLRLGPALYRRKSTIRSVLAPRDWPLGSPGRADASNAAKAEWGRRSVPA